MRSFFIVADERARRFVEHAQVEEARQTGRETGACAAHQYFFDRRGEVVAGSVRPPRLELANEALLRAHIQAAWLAQVCLPLGQSIEQMIDTDHDDLQLRENVADQVQLGSAARHELRERVRRGMRRRGAS